MSKDDTFFFEEDPEAVPGTELTPEEHANTFLSLLEDSGIIQDRTPLSEFDKQLTNVSEINTKKLRTSLVEIEYGTIKADYVLHVIPIHPNKNLKAVELLNLAIKTTVQLLNKIVPTTLRVEIFLPRPDYEIKATSYIIRDAVEAWNFDAKPIEEIIPTILEQVGKICMMS